MAFLIIIWGIPFALIGLAILILFAMFGKGVFWILMHPLRVIFGLLRFSFFTLITIGIILALALTFA